MAYLPNPGKLPPECVILDDETGEVVGYRSVHVVLFGGYSTKAAGDRPWPSAGGKPLPTRWAISRQPHPFEIKEFEIV